MKNQNYLQVVVSIVTVFLLLSLAGCGGGVELTYRVEGTASEAEVAYTNADGETEEVTVSLPWEMTLSVGSEFSFELEVIDESGGGPVTCQVLVGDNSLGEGTGNSSVECQGSFSKRGNSMTSSFSSVVDPLARAHVETGTDYLDQGQIDEAVAEFEEAVRLAPNLAEAHRKLGIAYYEQSQLDEAIAEFQRAIELDPDSAEAHRSLGTTYWEQGKLEEAIASYEKAIELEPDFGEAYGDLAGVYGELGRLAEAIETGEKAIELAPDYATAHNNLGVTYDKQGRLDEAIAEYKEAIRIDPDHIDAHYNLGLSYAKQDRLDEAISWWKKTLEIDPEHSSAHKNLGVAYVRQGRLDEAIAELETYLQLRPDAPDRAAVEEDIARLREQVAGAGIVYTNAAGGYSLHYPQGWYYVEDETEVTLAPSREDYQASSLQSPLFTFIVWPLAQAAESFDLEEAAAPAAFLQVLAGRLEAEIGGMENFEIAGYPAAVATVSGDLRGTSYGGDMIIVLVEERLLLAEGLAPTDQWADVRPTFVDMVNSLSFFEPQE